MTTAIGREGRQALKDFFEAAWWLTLIRGVALILLGILIFARPGISTIVLSQFLGFYFLVDGIAALVAGIMNRTDARAWTLIRGVIGILAGGTIIFNPLSSALGLATFGMVFLGASSLFQGVFEIVEAIRYRKIIDQAWLVVVGGIVALLFGLLLLSAPIIMGVGLIRFIAFFMIVAGIVICVLAFRVRSAIKDVTSTI